MIEKIASEPEKYKDGMSAGIVQLLEWFSVEDVKTMCKKDAIFVAAFGSCCEKY